MPVLIKSILIALLNFFLPWLQQNASTVIVAIVQEVLLFLKGIPAQASHVQELEKLLEHIRLFTTKK